MQYKIPNAYSFLVWHCIDVYSIGSITRTEYIAYTFLKLSRTEAIFIPMLLKYVKYTTYNIFLSTVVNYLKL
jgi:hypothetical protein